MQYRDIKKLNTKVSTFGVGCMRLPLEADANGDSARIDEKKAIEMIHYAIDNGVNYVDTAYVYHAEHSETILGKALAQGGYRNKTLIATKFPAYKMAYEKYDELRANPPMVIENILDEQLKKLQTDHIDMYLVHNLEKKRWPLLRDVGILDTLERMRDKGKINYIGFSFHDDYELFESIVDYYDWDMAQIQLNILDENYQAGVAGLKYAASKGIPVTIMEPLRGGSLANNVPEEVASLYNNFKIRRSVVDWCFRWICNFPEVMTVLSGVSNMEQTKQNVEMFNDMLPNSMTQEEIDLIKKVQDIYKSRIKVPCTKCAYCMPCPQGINIPEIFSVYNNASMFNNKQRGQGEYEAIVNKAADASLCIQCGSCESHCPQSIGIIDRLVDARGYLKK